jgi:hypothetical protein
MRKAPIQIAAVLRLRSVPSNLAVLSRILFTLLLGATALWIMTATAGGQVFVADTNYPVGSRIGEFTTSGATVNTARITASDGLYNPWGLATSGGNLYVTNYSDGTISGGTVGEYTATGQAVNPALISGLTGPTTIAASGGNLFCRQRVRHDR